MAFDMIGGASDLNATLAELHSLHRRDRLVLIGSMGMPLPLSYMAHGQQLGDHRQLHVSY
jgi:alcohol dehydrogenase